LLAGGAGVFSKSSSSDDNAKPSFLMAVFSYASFCDFNLRMKSSLDTYSLRASSLSGISYSMFQFFDAGLPIFSSPRRELE